MKRNGRLLGIVLALAFIFGFAMNHAVFAKVDLKDFTPDQQAWLWQKVQEYAKYEAFERACGHNTHFEERVLAAVKSCATESAIQSVRAVFHKRINLELKIDTPSICTLPQSPELLTGLEKSLNSAVQDIENACRSCLTC